MRAFAAFALAGLILACGSPQPSAELQGLMTLSLAYKEPPPGAPISIGGTAVFVNLNGPDGEQVYSGELNPRTKSNQPSATPPIFELPAGDYPLQATVHFASDAIEIDQNGNVHRDLGPISATCSGTIRISPPDLAAVIITAFGGSSCTISLAQ
ncbi:MAG: hypothetical protein QOJ81_2305 [Chloroflexota bacterium]|nr:hypothetical protein [Chloroflexota bacterium]